MLNQNWLSAKVAGNCRIGRQAPALSAPKCSFRGAESSRISGFGGEPQNSICEPAQTLPVCCEVDVLVAGGGPAGICAALAAARGGARVALVETMGCLGGIWTSGLLPWILDCKNKTGLLQELFGRLEGCGARQPLQFNAVACDPEVLKLVLEEMCLESGVQLRLHTRVTAAMREGSGRRVGWAITESKSGREAWKAKVFIDATGDGDLAARAGCGFDLGRQGTGQTQPMSLQLLLAGLRFDEIHDFVHAEHAAYRSSTGKLLALLAGVGVDPSYHAPILIKIYDDLYAMMTNHEYDVKGTNAADVTSATLAARRELHTVISALKKSGGPWKDVRIVATGEQIGVREGRRIHGLYTVSTDDLVAGARHTDAVCRVTFGVDVHSPSKSEGKSFVKYNIKSQPYDIPMRALIARDVDGLLLAGRCISGDFIAHSSYRVTGNACAMGQGAGVCAALAAKAGLLPQQVEWPAIREGLLALGTVFAVD